MKCTRRTSLSLKPTVRLLASFFKAPQDEEAKQEKLRREAEAKGFAGRDSVDDKIFLQKTFDATEKISGNVTVANLPAKVKEKTDFDKYQRSTAEFTSLVSPHGVIGVGLGAGFGAKEDKRLGFLRPRQSLQPQTGSADSVAKYDENGMPIEGKLTRDQLIKKKMEYMKSFEGMTMSSNEHFLLVDLDYSKDAILFGSTREEFESNVQKMKNVIIAYNKWERTDNFYYYSTIMLKLTTIWVMMECLQQYYELRLLAGNYDEFASVMEAEIADLDARRRDDLARASKQLDHHSPDFAPVLLTISAEKERVLEERKRAELQEQAAESSGIVVSAETIASAHPMDTTGDQKYTEQLKNEEQAREMYRLQQSAVRGESVWATVWRKVRGSSVALPPLSEADYATYSYAASPTSIEAVRLIRRTLLPRSEDYTQIVREEMLTYKKEKENCTLFPQ